MPKVRYYFQLNPGVVDQFGGHQFITAETDKPHDGHLPRFGGMGPNTAYQLMFSSDRVIVCDGDSVRFAKNRHSSDWGPVDPAEFFEIKLRSVELW